MDVTVRNRVAIEKLLCVKIIFCFVVIQLQFGGGGGGFFRAFEDFGRMFDYSFPACAFFSFFFFKVDISSRTLKLFMPGSVHSGSVS